MPTDAQKKATAKYMKQNVKTLTIRFFPADIELYDHVQKQSNKQAYVRELIRKDMNV